MASSPNGKNGTIFYDRPSPLPSTSAPRTYSRITEQSSLKPSYELTGPCVRRPIVVNGKSGVIRRRRSLIGAEKAKAAPPISHDTRQTLSGIAQVIRRQTEALRTSEFPVLFLRRACAIPKEKGLAKQDYGGHGRTRPLGSCLLERE